MEQRISPSGKRVLALMRDGVPRSTRDIIVHAGVTDGSREVRRLIERGFFFVSEWRINDGVRFKVWKLKVC